MPARPGRRRRLPRIGLLEFGTVLHLLRIPVRSGRPKRGSTILNLPSLQNQIPTYDGSIPAGAFTAYADLSGTGTTTQVLAQTSSVRLKIVPRAGGAPVFDQDATPASDSVGPYVTANVDALSSGRYYANWPGRRRNSVTPVLAVAAYN